MASPKAALHKTRRKTSASRKVEDYIKNALYTGRLAPRERIIEEDLARQLGVSRGPVREALLRLETEGLLTITSRRGTFVRDFSIKEIRVIFKMRAKLEGLAVWYMRQRMTERDKATLTERVQSMKKAATDEDDEQFFYADMELHRTIWELSGESRLYGMLSRVMNPVIFEIARSYSSRWPIAHRYENHRSYSEMILTTPLGRVERAVESYFDKLYRPISSADTANGNGRRERPLLAARWG